MGAALKLKRVDAEQYFERPRGEPHEIMLKEREQEASVQKKIERLTRRSFAEVACGRLREFAVEIGGDVEYEVGWKRYVARRLGIDYTVLLRILDGTQTAIGFRTVDRACARTGVPLEVLMNSEAR